MSTATAPFFLYNPKIGHTNNRTIPAKKLIEQLTSFYKLYNPKKLQKEKMLEKGLQYARLHGVLALKGILKKRYNASLDEADVSEVGWSRLYAKLKEYLKLYSGKQSTTVNNAFFAAIKKNGLASVDVKLKKEYGESLSEFINFGLRKWKKNWSAFLKGHHSELVAYELTRFYVFLEFRNTKGLENKVMKELVDWATKHSRLEVNERLLEKYKFCLDDVKMIPGNTNSERQANLRLQLVEFYQMHDPDKLGRVTSTLSTETNESMKEIEKLVEWGYIHIEHLEDKLKKQYGHGLINYFDEELKLRLIEFYAINKVKKSISDILGIIDYANKKGLDAMNEKLVLAYGKGISTENLHH